MSKLKCCRHTLENSQCPSSSRAAHQAASSCCPYSQWLGGEETCHSHSIDAWQPSGPDETRTRIDPPGAHKSFSPRLEDARWHGLLPAFQPFSLPEASILNGQSLEAKRLVCGSCIGQTMMFRLHNNLRSRRLFLHYVFAHCRLAPIGNG